MPKTNRTQKRLPCSLKTTGRIEETYKTCGRCGNNTAPLIAVCPNCTEVLPDIEPAVQSPLLIAPESPCLPRADIAAADDVEVEEPLPPGILSVVILAALVVSSLILLVVHSH